MATIAITGAAGKVGRQAVQALSDDHDLTLLTHTESDDLESHVLEIEDREGFRDALEGQDVLIHLAANPSTSAAWDDLLGPNVEGVYNAFEAALANDLERVVFASSNHAVNMPNVAEPDRSMSTLERPQVIRPEDSMYPDTHYGVTKVFGEAMGRYYADRHGLEVVNLRIGWLLSREDLRERISGRDEAGARYVRGMWLSPRDCRGLLAASATAPLEEPLVTAHGVSNNTDRTLSLAETRHQLGYLPQDDSAVVLE